MTASVIGCVWGAWRELTARFESFGKPAPSYEWCEQQWRSGLAKTAPGHRAIPAWLTQELFFRWRQHVREHGQQLALDLGGAA